MLVLIHSRLDYCNGVLAGLPVHQINQLQAVQRAAARLVLRLPVRSSLSNLMTSELHWLPYPQRITFKLCIFAYKCNHGMAPSYLSDLCVRLAKRDWVVKSSISFKRRLTDLHNQQRTAGSPWIFLCLPNSLELVKWLSENWHFNIWCIQKAIENIPFLYLNLLLAPLRHIFV